MGSGPRIQIWHPHMAHLLEGEWPDLGKFGGADRTPTCIQKLVDKKLKLVNVVQVMLIRRILPCQQRAFNLWEFDPAQHQTLNRLFDTTHEDAWKVLFKGAEVPPPTTEDRGFCAKRQASAVSLVYPLQGTCFS